MPKKYLVLAMHGEASCTERVSRVARNTGKPTREHTREYGIYLFRDIRVAIFSSKMARIYKLDIRVNI